MGIFCREKLTSPRVLTCLHVYCEECIDGLLKDNDDPLNANTSVDCPECNQATVVSIHSFSSFQIEYSAKRECPIDKCNRIIDLWKCGIASAGLCVDEYFGLVIDGTGRTAMHLMQEC